MKSIPLSSKKKRLKEEENLSLKSAKAASLGSLALGTPLMGVAQSALASGSKAPASTRPKEIEAFWSDQEIRTLSISQD